MSGTKTFTLPREDTWPTPILKVGERLKILALGDAPIFNPVYGITGFGRVMRNVLHRWHALQDQVYDEMSVDCWAIGFDGYGYDQVPYRLLPAGKEDWRSPKRLNQLLRLLADGDYTHLFLLMDPDALSVQGFPQKLRQVCREKGVRVMLYYPVDATLEREWLAILDAVDVAVTYTEYGRAETRKALGKSLYPIEVVPHGVDDCFKPLPAEDCQKARSIELQVVRDGKQQVVNFVEEDTFLMVNVNKNEWRKDPLRSLEILARLRKLGVPAKLLFRMDVMSAMGGIHLDMAAKQLGLTYGKEYCHVGPIGDEAMVALYNASDLYLTTSLGEGWGLGVTEAMACHTPVAMPQHTSLAEIGTGAGATPGTGEAPMLPEQYGVIWLPMEEGFVCGADTRLRRRVCVPGAAEHIYQAYGLRCGQGVRNAPANGHLKSWDWVADELFKLLVEHPVRTPGLQTHEGVAA